MKKIHSGRSFRQRREKRRRRTTDLREYQHLTDIGVQDMIIKLHNVRLAFPDLFIPTAFEAGQEEKYGATFLVPKDSPLVKEIEHAINEVAAQKWGAKAKATLDGIRGNSQKYCFVDGDTKGQYDGFLGHMALSAKNEKRPLVIDRDKTSLTSGDGRPYAGCYVHGSVEIWAQDNKWGKGIRASLRGVQFFREGDAFGGGAPASAEEFDDLAVGADADALV
jgi:Protein of unknown function (DUF2815)